MNFRVEYSGEPGNLSAALIEIGSNEAVETASGLKDSKAVDRFARRAAIAHKAALAVDASRTETVQIVGTSTFSL